MKTLMTIPSALMLTLALTACGGSGDGANDADKTFAQSMVPHHEQAVDMAELALEDGRDTSPEVRDLATRVDAAQDPEIEQMNGWLEEWDTQGAAHDDHAGMDGMMSGAQMTELEQASGSAFDELWLTLMIEHHEGAVTMAENVLTEGSDADVAALAQEILDAQQAEITQMEALLDD